MSSVYKSLNPAELLESSKHNPIEYLVDGLLPVGSLNMLAGKPKSGKSTLVRQLAACIAKGTDFLGRSTIKAKVLYFASEEIGAHLAEHFGLLGISKAEDGVHTVLGRPGAGFVTKLSETLKAMPEVKLVIVDPLINFLQNVDLDKYGEVAPALANLVEAANKQGVSLLCVHHNKKKDVSEVGDSVLGSSAIIGSMCTTMFLQGELGNTRTIKSSQRYGIRLEPTQLEFSQATCSFSLGQTATVLAEQRAAHNRESRINQTLMCVQLWPDGISQDNLRPLVKCNAKELIDVLDALEQDGRLLRTGQGKRGDPYLYSVPKIVTLDSESPAAII